MRLTALTSAALLAAALAVDASAQETVRGARHPALSADGRWLAFSWRGDLWKAPSGGGEAARLTVNPGDDRLPQWSPDGRWLAFSAKREGNYDVYIISSSGSSTRQLTFHSSDDLVQGWTADGSAVMFTSARDFDRGVLWQVPLRGGTERKLTRGQAAYASLSPDGRTLLVASGAPGAWWRKGYRGANNWAVWSRPVDRMGGAARLTTFNGRNGWPQFASDGRAIYYLSDSTGVTELWRMGADGSGKESVTRMGRDGARFLSVARGAPVAAFEMDAGVWTVSLTGTATNGTPAFTPQEVRITAASDEQMSRTFRQTYTDRASDLALSRDGREVAFVVRGEVFVQGTRSGAPTENISNHHARDFALEWSPDGRSLVFISDRAGTEDVWLARSADSAEPRLSRAVRVQLTQLTRETSLENNASWSPDGRRIAFTRSGDPPSLWVMNADGTNPVRLVAGYVQAYNWSPDGQYLAYGMSQNFRGGTPGSDIFVIPSAGGQSVNVTNYPAQNRSPQWTRDGRRLVFVSTRGPGEGNSDLYQIWLRRADDEKTREDWGAEEDRPSGRDTSAARTPAVTIDFEGIGDRVRRVTDGFRVGGFAISPDGRTFALSANVMGQTDLYSVDRWGENVTRLTRGNTQPAGGAFDADGRRVWYLTGRGTISSVETGGQNASSLGFQARVTIDRQAESVQMFEESWRRLGAAFYDPRMHGRDWQAVRAAYRPMAEAAYTREALGDVVLMMIGELNASHLNFTLPAEDNPVRTGELGLVFDDGYRGRGLRVSAVVPGGPTDRTSSRVRAGEYLLEVNGQPITDTTNVYALLNGTVADRIAIRVAATAEGQSARSITVRPAAGNELGDLLYYEFVQRNHQRVQQLSGGRVGYLHIRAMDQPSLERFKRDLWGREVEREAVIIDQRYNGGGNIHEQLWGELARRAPGYTTNRAGQRRFSPSQWAKPTIVMQNQNSFSDAEIFPFGVRVLGLARTLGVPTGGGVIGTQNVQLVDGSTFRLPGSGWFSLEGRNLENWGIEPDIWVENPFEQEQLGTDQQLERAVRELLQQIGPERR